MHGCVRQGVGPQPSEEPLRDSYFVHGENNMTGNTTKKFGFTRGAGIALAIVCGVITAASSADAQCLRVTTVKGKARLSTSALRANGKCPPGSVAVGASTGTVGAPGAQGPQGPMGPMGPRGVSAFEPIPSGKTVYGVIGVTDGKNANDTVYLYASLPAVASVPIPAANVVVRANEALLGDCSGQSCLSARMQAVQSACPGTSSNPTAAPGFVCIYPTAVRGGFQDGSISGYDLFTESGAFTRVGFSFSYGTSVTGNTYFEGIWAYTAP